MRRKVELAGQSAWAMADDDGQRRAAEFMALSAIYEGVIGPDVDGPWQIPLDVGDAVLEIHLPGLLSVYLVTNTHTFRT